MFSWRSIRLRRSKQQTIDLLVQSLTQLKESHEATIALAEKAIKLNGDIASQVAEATKLNARLWTALSAPIALQPYIAAGCSEAEATQLAREAPRHA